MTGLAIEAVAKNLGLHRAGREWRGTCPACGYATSFTLSRGKGGRSLGWCASCQDNGAIAAALRAAGAEKATDWHNDRGADDAPARAALSALKRDRAIRLWNASEQVAGTIAESYLASRGVAALAVSSALRFRGDCWHPAGGNFPAMVAAVTGPDGTTLAVHRTYLASDGSGKAAIDPPKASLGPLWGGAIRLSPVAAEIVIGEGIESAASAGIFLGLPAWSALSAGNLAAGLQLPPEVRSIVIAADADLPGRTAATNAAARWEAEGRTVRIALPDHPGSDFNDLLRSKAPERL